MQPKYAALFFCTAASLLLGLAPPARAFTRSGPYTIDSIIIGSQGAHIELSPAPVGCTNNWEGTQFVVLRDHIMFKELLAGLISAKSQKNRVSIWHDPQGDGTCSFKNQPIIQAIQIKD